MHSWNLVALLAGVIVLGGCSDPARFAEPVSVMRIGTDQVSRAVTGSMREIASEPDLRSQYCLADAKPDHTADDRLCGPAWWEASDQTRIAYARIWFGSEAFDALSVYAGALERVLVAESGEPLRIAVLNLGYAVGALRDATATLPGSGHLTRSRVMMSAIGSFLIDIEPDIARGEALEQAVFAMDPVIDTLVELVAVDVQFAHGLHLANAPVRLDGLVQFAVAPGEGESQADELAPDELAMIVVGADPSEALHRLAAAHDALGRAIADGSDESFAEMEAAVEQFAHSAETVYSVYAGFLSILDP